jgi:hypothetical protein
VACVARLRSGESATLSVTDECLFGTAIRDNAANSIQFHEDSRSLARRIASEALSSSLACWTRDNAPAKLGAHYGAALSDVCLENAEMKEAAN